MRNLNEINAAAKSTRFAFMVSLIIPIIMGSGAWALAAGAAPDLPLQDNYLEIIALGIMASAIFMLPFLYLLKWNWEAKYFGAALFCFATGSILGIYPILCITLYSSLPPTIRFAPLVVNIVIITRWCHRFVKIYRIIYLDKNLFNYIYHEEPTAFYYLQEADKKVIDKAFKFEQFPSSIFFALSLLVAFSTIPFATSLSKFLGLPFIHIFLAIGAAPLNLMFLGLSTKMWLIYYFYPAKITKISNKPVYVDISSQPAKSIKLRYSSGHPNDA